MGHPVTEKNDRDRISLVYDSNMNLIEIREFSYLGKQGDQVVNVTELFYDANYNVVRIVPNYRKDTITSSDIS